MGDDFTYKNVRIVAQGIANYLGDEKRPVVIGHDTRFSAELFAREVTEVLCGNGLRVLLVDGPIPTPAICWNVVERGGAGGVVITASHNPPEFNGIKFKSSVGGSASAETVEGIEKGIVQAETRGVKSFDFDKALKIGKVEKIDGLSCYLRQLRRMVDLEKITNRRFRIAHDAMYGSGMGVLEKMLEGISEISPLHNVRNPNFPGIHPEPIEENLGELIELVTKEGANFHFGVANDGDADRMGLVDPRTGYVDSLEVLSLFSMYLMEKQKSKAPIVRSVSESSRVDKLGERFGVPILESPVEFKSASRIMLENKAALAGEESGSYAFLRHLPERDGILAALIIMEIMTAYGRGLYEVREHLWELVGKRGYHRRDVRFPREGYGETKKRILSKLEDSNLEKIGGEKVLRVSKLDGYKFYLTGDSWILIRMSGTEPLMRVYCEAENVPRAKEIIESFLSGF